MNSRGLPSLESPTFSALWTERPARELERALTEHIRSRRWFRGKARGIRSLEILDDLPLRAAPHELALLVVRVAYTSDAPEVYVLPLALAPEGSPAAGDRGLLELRLGSGGSVRQGVLYDPTGDADLSQLLLELFVREQSKGKNGSVFARPSAALKAAVGSGREPLPARVPSGEQSNTTVFFGHELMLKLFRQLEAGENPDVELNEFLWAHGYRHVPEPLGSVRYAREGFDATLGIAQRFVPSEGTAWDVTLNMLNGALQLATGMDPNLAQSNLPVGDLLDSSCQNPPEELEPFLAAYAVFATLLGERTAELHLTLASNSAAVAFAPEPLELERQRAMVTATRERIARSCALLSKQLGTLPEGAQPLAKEVLASREILTSTLDRLESLPVRVSLIRCHGDYHLGQVLYGGNDFTLLDFEGEPAQPLEARRRKLSALYDVCGMLRSFHYAATVALQDARWPAEQRASLSVWADAWYRWTSATFLCAYLKKARESGRATFVPDAPEEQRALLGLHMIDKCSYELSYELNNRPAWVSVPMAGLLSLARER